MLLIIGLLQWTFRLTVSYVTLVGGKSGLRITKQPRYCHGFTLARLGRRAESETELSLAVQMASHQNANKDQQKRLAPRALSADLAWIGPRHPHRSERNALRLARSGVVGH